MRMSTISNVLLIISLDYISVITGILWWKISVAYCLSDYSLARWGFTSVLSTLAELLEFYLAGRRCLPGEVTQLRRLTGLLSLYFILVITIDPFLHIHARTEWPFYALVAAFPLTLMGQLISHKARIAICGVALFTASAIACLLFNGSAVNFGIGFSGAYVQ